MKGSFPLASWGCSAKGKRDIIEQAKEELQILEAQEPDRFNYLKLELKSFISFLESQNFTLSENKCGKMLAWAADSTSATTQVSSTCKKRKKVDIENQEIMEASVEATKKKFQRVDRLDAVFERARECLDKIQQFKQLISEEN